MIDQFRTLRVVEKLSLGEICNRLNISKGTASSYLRRVETEMSPEEVQSLRAEIGSRPGPQGLSKEKYQIWQQSRAIEELEAQVQARAEFKEGLKSVAKGLAAEYFVKYQLSARGIEWFDPTAQAEACDLLVKVGSRYLRCEIKGSMDSKIGLKRTLVNLSEVRQSPYGTDSGIDFFIVVRLDIEVMAMIPFKENISSVILTSKSEAWKWVNNFDFHTEI